MSMPPRPVQNRPQQPGGQRPAGAGGPPPSPARLSRDQVNGLLAPTGYATVNVLAQQVANTLANGGVTKSQVRNVLNSFQNIAEPWESLSPAERRRQIAK